jgi:hypothetical protein
MSLSEFDKFLGKWCELKKVQGDRFSFVPVGLSETGEFSFHDYTIYVDIGDKTIGGSVKGRGMHDYLRTSPINEVIEVSDGFIRFSTINASTYELRIIQGHQVVANSEESEDETL